MSVTTFGCDKIGTQKIKKNFFFQDKFYSKAHPGYFTVLIYLATWRAAELDIFTHFRFVNLPQYRQSINSFMYVYYTDPQLFFFFFFMITLICTTDTPKNLSVLSLVYNLATCSNYSITKCVKIVSFFLKRWIRDN